MILGAGVIKPGCTRVQFPARATVKKISSMLTGKESGAYMQI